MIHSRKTPGQALEVQLYTVNRYRELRQTAAVSRCVSELHGKKYRILEIYPFAARKPVRTYAVEAYRKSGEARRANHPQHLPA